MDVADSTPYSYQALSTWQIRVLTLFPGSFGDELWARLDVLDLERPSQSTPSSSNLTVTSEEHGDAHQYEALSYAWGDNTLSHTVNCLDGSYFSVTQSLHEALQYLRYSSKPRPLWADAICINQDDTSERAAQVAIMATVYESAKRVLIWLGTTDAEGGLAFGILYAHAACLDEQSQLDDPNFDFAAALTRKLKMNPRCPCCGIGFGNFEDVDIAFQTVVDMYRLKEWFGRTWVYQEAACAKSIEVHCGTHYCNWELMRTFRDPYYSGIWPSELEILRICQSMRDEEFDPLALLRLLILLRHTLCREPQDTIFAIRSIARIEHMTSLKPDYTLSAAEIYRRVVVESLSYQETGARDVQRTTSFLNQDNTPGFPLPHVSLLLALPRTTHVEADPGLDGLLSWVPAFNSLTDCSSAKYYEYAWHLGFSYLHYDENEANQRNASKAPMPGRLRFQLDSHRRNLLWVLGGRIAQISEILENSTSPLAYDLEELNDRDFADNATRLYHRWVVRCKQFVSCHAELSLRNFKELMYCSSPSNGFDPFIYTFMMRGEPSGDDDECLEWIIREFTTSQFEDPLRTLRYYDHFRNLCSVTTASQKKLLGWIPEAAEPGDMLCLFVGCPRPFVLRQRDENSFELLGDAWIQGVPDKASFLIPEDRKKWFQLY